MKKFLALLLSIAMLLGACAFAEEAAPTGHSHRLSDVVITYGGNTIDLSNLALCADISPEGDAVLVHLDADGETAAELGFTKVDNLYAMHVAGTISGHTDFVSDPVVQLAKTLQSGVDGLIGILQNVDTHALAEKIMSFGEQPMDEPEAEPEEEPVEEPEEELEMEGDGETLVFNLSDLSFHGDIAAMLEDCVSEEKGVEIDDSTIIPAGTYDVTIFYASEETCADLLNMVYVKDEPVDLGDKLRDAGVTMSAGVAMYQAEGAEATDCTLTLSSGEEVYSAHIVTAHTSDEIGSTGAYDISCNKNGELMGVKFTTYSGEIEDKTFSPDSIDLVNAVNLDELSDEEASETLIGALKTLMVDATLPVLGPVMEAASANGDLLALLSGAALEDAEVPEA